MPLPSNILDQPAPHAEASKWIEDKPLVSRAVFDGLLPELQARAFLITGVEDANVVADIRSIIAKLPQGLDWLDAKKQIAAKLGPWLESEDTPGGKKSANARAELLLRTHGFQAYQVVQHRVMRSQEDVFPFWQYLSLDDEKVRPGHAALNGKVAPASSPFWHDHSPPWQWGCRCRKAPLLPDEVDDLKAMDAKLPPEKRSVLEGPALDLAEEGRMYNSAGQQLDIKSDRQKGKMSGFIFYADALTMPLEQLRARYDALTWSEFEARSRAAKLEDGRTVWGWLNGATAPIRTRPVKDINARVTKAVAKAAKARREAGIMLVSDAVELPQGAADKALAKSVLKAIDAVHEDGVLPTSKVITAPAAVIDALGDYHCATNRIRYAPNGGWPRMTLAHEVGHFIDLRGLGDGASFASVRRRSPEWRAWWQAITDSAHYKALPTCYDPAYFMEPFECWARAYAQFIATESGDATLLADLQTIRGVQAWRQWSDEDFKPIAEAMRGVLKAEGWIK